MKYSTKLSDTVHVMVLIAINQEKSLSSASIAESVHTNPGFVRQLMLKLKKAELMTSVAGHARPSLSKPADQITLLDIYKAVEGEKPLLHLDTHTNPDCGVGINIQLSLQGFYNEIQKTAEGKMNTITLQDIIDTYNSNFFTNNARIAFNTARIITPTSAKIASHILAIPTAPRIRQISFTPMATEIF